MRKAWAEAAITAAILQTTSHGTASSPPIVRELIRNCKKRWAPAKWAAERDTCLLDTCRKIITDVLRLPLARSGTSKRRLAEVHDVAAASISVSRQLSGCPSQQLPLQPQSSQSSRSCWFVPGFLGEGATNRSLDNPAERAACTFAKSKSVPDPAKIRRPMVRRGARRPGCWCAVLGQGGEGGSIDRGRRGYASFCGVWISCPPVRRGVVAGSGVGGGRSTALGASSKTNNNIFLNYVPGTYLLALKHADLQGEFSC